MLLSLYHLYTWTHIDAERNSMWANSVPRNTVDFTLVLCNDHHWGEGQKYTTWSMNHQHGLGHLQLFCGASPCQWWRDLCSVPALVLGICHFLSIAHCKAITSQKACLPLLSIAVSMQDYRARRAHASHSLHRWFQRPDLGGWGPRIYSDLPVTAMEPQKNHFTSFTLSLLTYNMRETAPVSQGYHISLTVYNYNENSNIENKITLWPSICIHVCVCVRAHAHAHA